MAHFKNPDWLSTSQVAAILRVSQQTVIRLCNRGELKFVTPFGSKWRAITRAAIRAYLATNPGLAEFALPF